MKAEVQLARLESSCGCEAPPGSATLSPKPFCSVQGVGFKVWLLLVSGKRSIFWQSFCISELDLAICIESLRQAQHEARSYTFQRGFIAKGFGFRLCRNKTSAMHKFFVLQATSTFSTFWYDRSVVNFCARTKPTVDQQVRRCRVHTLTILCVDMSGLGVSEPKLLRLLPDLHSFKHGRSSFSLSLSPSLSLSLSLSASPLPSLPASLTVGPSDDLGTHV